MSAPPPDLLAYHLGIVVHDLDAVAERYTALLGVDDWRRREAVIDWQSFVPGYSPAVRAKVAFGRGPGVTIELIQMVDGVGQHSEFLERHGEGVQHIGFWTPDVRAAVEHAVANGARIISAYMDASNNAVVQLTPTSEPASIIPALDPRMLAYVDPGLGGVQLEFVGPARAQGLKAWLGDAYEPWLSPPEGAGFRT